MVKIRENINDIELEKIRREWDEKSDKYYFSVVDTIGMLTESADPRNYWKVLKSRLKNTQNKLVTECNQLKMKSNDGKFYLTDTLYSSTILELINLISPKNIVTFREYFDNLEHPQKESYPQKEANVLEELNGEYAPLVDAYQTNTHIIIKAILAGVSMENISISVTEKNLTIKGTRKKPENNNYLIEELCWGKFFRSISLPAQVEINNALASCENGILKIKLEKINKLQKRFVEIKPSTNIIEEL